jgi:WD repeat-containing protein 55
MGCQSFTGRGDDLVLARGKLSLCISSRLTLTPTIIPQEFISGLAYDADSYNLISVAGDATLCAYDIRQSGTTFRSDEQESEITCVDFIKDNRKVICGTQEGVVLIFSVGRWGDCSDRYIGHTQTIDCMLKLDEATVLTGSSDGRIRVMSVLPNRILGILGDHEELPVEGIRRSHDESMIASFSHDEVVRFYDTKLLFEDMAVDEAAEQNASSASAAAGERMTDAEAMIDSDDSDDVENDNDEDSDDSDEDSGANNTAPRRKILTPAQRFYSDL